MVDKSKNGTQVGKTAAQESRNAQLMAFRRPSALHDRDHTRFESISFCITQKGRSKRNNICQCPSDNERSQPTGQRPECWTFLNGSDSEVHENRSSCTRKCSDTPHSELRRWQTYGKFLRFPNQFQISQLQLTTSSQFHHPRGWSTFRQVAASLHPSRRSRKR